MSITVKFVRRSTQDQFNFSHSSALALLAAAGLPKETKLGFKKGRSLLATTENGTPFLIGDTHAVWKSHQTSDAVKALYDRVNEGQGFTLTFESVEEVHLGATVVEVEVSL